MTDGGGKEGEKGGVIENMREQTDKTHIGVFPMAVFFARLLALAMFPPHVSN